MCLSVPVDRDNNNNIDNPIFTGTVEATTKDTAEPDFEEHIYDTINCYDDDDNGDDDKKNEKQEVKAKYKTPSNTYQNFLKPSSKGASIKSDKVQHNKSGVHCMQDTNKREAHYYNQTPPSVSNQATSAPASKACYYQTTKRELNPEEYYLLPDVKCPTGNQYATLDETRKAESNLYTSLAVPQHAELIGNQPTPRSKYVTPRNTSAAK